MSGTPRTKTALLAAAAFAAAGTVVSVAVVVARGPSASPVEWLVPLVTGALIGTVTVLLSDEDSRRSDEDEFDLTQTECAACGSQILREWRLCPHCGSLLACDADVLRNAAARHPNV